MNEKEQKPVDDRLEKFEIQNELIDKFARETVANLLYIARRRPDEFPSWFCGAIISNVVGNLDAATWAHFDNERNVPCGRPGCDCHLQKHPLIDALLQARIDHQLHCPRE